jgi:hypothetical protein
MRVIMSVSLRGIVGIRTLSFDNQNMWLKLAVEVLFPHQGRF